MSPIEFVKVLKEVGLAVGAMGLCIWIVVYIVRQLGKTVEKLADKIENVGGSFKMFADRVRSEHDSHAESLKEMREDHKEFAAQNREITAALGRINGYKDGYKE